MKRRTFLQATSLSLFSFNLTAKSAIDKKATLANSIRANFEGENLNVLYPMGSLANIKAVVDLFQRDTGVQVQLREASLSTISSELMLENKILASSDYSDIVLPPTFSIPDLVESDAIADLTDLAKKYQSFSSDEKSLYGQGDFYKKRFYGFQSDGDTYLLFLNKKMFNDANLRKKYKNENGKTLEIPHTWEELDEQMSFFHKPHEGRFGGSLFRSKDFIHWEYWMRLHAKGIFPFDSDFRPQLLKAESVDALTELIASSNYQEKKSKRNGLFENFESFSLGNKYCNLGWGGTQKFLRKKNNLDDDFIYTLPPGGAVKPFSYFNWGWNYVVNKKSKKKELAYLFSLYASLKVPSALSVSKIDGYFDPFKPSHFTHRAIIMNYGEKFLKVHKKSFENCIPDLYIQGQGLYFAILKDAIIAADRGILKPALALKLAAEKWESLTEKIGRENQKNQWRLLLKRYPKEFLRE